MLGVINKMSSQVIANLNVKCRVWFYKPTKEDQKEQCDFYTGFKHTKANRAFEIYLNDTLVREGNICFKCYRELYEEHKMEWWK